MAEDGVQKRSLVSYRDRLLGINGFHLEDSEDEEMLLDDQEDDEEDVEVHLEDMDPLCPVVPISMEERKEWCKL